MNRQLKLGKLFITRSKTLFSSTEDYLEGKLASLQNLKTFLGQNPKKKHQTKSLYRVSLAN